MRPRLLTLDEAAETPGVRVASLRGAAERHGYLIRMDRAVRIDPNDIEEIVNRCRDHPQEHASAAARTRASSSSATATGTSAQANEIAEKLIRHSPVTSRSATGQREAHVLPIR